MADDKKPISRAKLVRLLTPARKKELSVEKPTLASVSATGGKGKPRPPKVIAPAIKSSTAVADLAMKAEFDKSVQKTFDNTIKYVAEGMGMSAPKPGTNIYEAIRSNIADQKKAGGLIATKDDKGNPIYGTTQSFIKDLSESVSEYLNMGKKGNDYMFGEKDANLRTLETIRLRRSGEQLPKVRNPIAEIVGKMTFPIAQGVTGAVGGTAVAGPYGAIPGFIFGAGTTFALSAPDAVAIKYGETIEDTYIKARGQGMDKDSAYNSAINTARVAAGGEVALQAFFATAGGTKSITKPVFSEIKKKSFGNLVSQTAKSVGVKLKDPIALGTAAFSTKLMTDIEAEKQGIDIDDKLSRALSAGSDFFLLDLGVKTLSKITLAPKYIRSAMANLMSDADRDITKQFIAEGERQGVYPKGTGRKVTEAVNQFKAAKEQSPDFGNDVDRENVVAGLTQKLNNLLEKQSKLADIHKADMQPEIDEVVKRIQTAKTAKNPLEAEFNDDGTPLIKTEKYATTTTEGKVEEGVPESRVSEYQGAEEVKPVEATVEAEAPKTDTGNRPISGTEEKVTPSKKKPTVETAESQMEGVSTEDAAELMRIATRVFDKEEAKDFEGIAAIMRKEMESKTDMSKISDATLVKLAEEAVSKSEKYPFKKGTAKRIKFTFEDEVEPMRINARDAFRGMYFGAQTLAKSVKERLSMSSNAIKEALKGTGLDLDENALSRSIGKFVSSRMDTDTAMQSFMDNLDDIIGDAQNVVEKSNARKNIASIIKASKSPSYSTVAIKENVASIDWISPSKINPEKLGEYNRLLEDYQNSIKGKIPESATIRKDLMAFTQQQREWANTKKSERLGNKYDSLVKKGEIDPNIVSKDEYVFWGMEPEAKVRPEAENVLKALDETEADVMKDMTTVRQEMLGEYINSDEMNPEYLDAANEVKGFDVNKVSAKNIKLLNNIIEDIMSGERPSRIGDISTDIGAFDALQKMKNVRVRSVAGIKTAGALKIRKAFEKGWEGVADNYKKFGLTNIMRQIGFNEGDRNIFRSSILGDFPKKMYSLVTDKSKEAAENISNIFTKGKVGNLSFKSGRLSELNDYRIGIVATLRQFEDLYTNLETVKNSLLTLSKIANDNVGEYGDYVKNSIEALKSLDLIDNVIETDGFITDITFKQGKNSNDLVSLLNDRELAAYDYAKKSFGDLAPTLDNTVRDVYGVGLDMTNENYLPLSTFFTGDNKVIDLEDSPFGAMPSFVRSMRAGTTFERQPMLVGKTMREGKEAFVHYDFRFMKNYLSKYHESLSTAYTARDVKQISKIINSKDFSDIMSGAYNVEPRIYNENADVVNDAIKNYVNGIRSPYKISSAQAKERSTLSKFFYGKLLYSYNQVFKQTIPSYAYLVTEANGNPMPFVNAHKILSKSLLDRESLDALKVFLNSTAQTDRVAGGLEIFHKELADLDVSDVRRMMRKVNNVTNNIFSASFNLGDSYTTINSLLIGYMKGLNKYGKLESYSKFNLQDEIKKGLDRDALAYAESFLAQVNNESAAYSKAKVLRESDAPVTRLLQGFSLNQWANFQIDMGVATDKYATTSDKLGAVKRLMQYSASNALYALVAGAAFNYGIDGAKYIMRKSGIPLAPTTEETIEQEKNAEKMTYLRTFLGQGVEMMLGGTSVLAAQGVKLGASSALEGIKSYYRDQEEKMGKPIKGTWMDPSFNFIYRNNYIGINGSYFEDLERAYKTMTSKEEDQRIEEQRTTQKWLNAGIVASSILAPTPDFSTAFRNANKVLKNKSINRNEYLASILWESRNAENPNDRSYWQSVYDYETKDMKNRNIVEIKTLLPLADKLHVTNTISRGAKSFDRPGYKVSDVLVNMSTKYGEKMFKILNNRYAGQDINNNDELKFLVIEGGLTPTDYALAVGMDKEGKPIIGFDLEANWETIKNRYIEADRIVRNRRISMQPGEVGTVNELVELYAKYANQQALFEDINR